MTAVELLAHLRSLDVKLWIEGDRLHYSAAKNVLTPALRSGLAERKAEIIQLLQEAAVERSVAPVLRPRSRDGHLPLSFAQQRLWFLDQLVPGSAFYNIAGAIRLELILDVAALKSALNKIVQRHEALRTTFVARDGQPEQVIAASLHVGLPVVDLRDVPQDARQGEARRLAQEEARRPFDLGVGPLIRTSLLRLEEAEYWFLLTMHHIVSDGWSMDVFFGELSKLYGAYGRGEEPGLEELAIQYADYALWQREWLHGEVYQQQLGYWRGRLAGMPVLELPGDRRRPAALSYRGAHQELRLADDLAEGLRGLGEGEGATLFMTLLAGFVVLLHRYSGQDDIVVGTPIANRNRAEIEGLIGFFVNSLVLRVDVSGDPSFRELVRRVKEVALGGYAHQDLPFEKLVEELHPQRDLSRNPLFQVMFQLLTELRPATSAMSVEPGLTPVAVERGTTQFDMAIDLWAGSDGLSGQVEYSTDLFNHATITRLISHYCTLLESAAADPGQRISELPLLTEAERRQVLVEWNVTENDYPSEACIHQLFEEQVERTPDAPALAWGNEIASYRDLNARANQLANYLCESVVGPETLVGVCIDRSLELAVALLAVLKVGAAYVPIDPTYPNERLSFMLADSRAPLLLTVARLAGKIDVGDVERVCLDTLAEEISGRSRVNLTAPSEPDTLAYVVYTSGSTGAPKGVLIPNRTLVNHSTAVARRFHLQRGDRVLQCASLSFDVAAEEIFPTWLAGATVVLHP
ncbi:MAG TPA: condensation domain-containing protein, partial [Terriglobales bacterium]